VTARYRVEPAPQALEDVVQRKVQGKVIVMQAVCRN